MLPSGLLGPGPADSHRGVTINPTGAHCLSTGDCSPEKLACITQPALHCREGGETHRHGHRHTPRDLSYQPGHQPSPRGHACKLPITSTPRANPSPGPVFSPSRAASLSQDRDLSSYHRDLNVSCCMGPMSHRPTRRTKYSMCKNKGQGLTRTPWGPVMPTCWYQPKRNKDTCLADI